MTTLRPMGPDSFARFAANANPGYAQDNVLSGRWSAEEAPAKAIAEFNQLLPQGLETPDHFLFDVMDDKSEVVGGVWIALVGTGASRSAYVFNIYIEPTSRRLGHARRTLEAVEAFARTKGANAMRLNVFAHNPGAEALYVSLGYAATSKIMRKAFAAGDA